MGYMNKTVLEETNTGLLNSCLLGDQDADDL